MDFNIPANGTPAMKVGNDSRSAKIDLDAIEALKLEHMNKLNTLLDLSVPFGPDGLQQITAMDRDTVNTYVQILTEITSKTPTTSENPHLKITNVEELGNFELTQTTESGEIKLELMVTATLRNPQMPQHHIKLHSPMTLFGMSIQDLQAGWRETLRILISKQKMYM